MSKNRRKHGGQTINVNSPEGLDDVAVVAALKASRAALNAAVTAVNAAATAVEDASVTRTTSSEGTNDATDKVVQWTQHRKETEQRFAAKSDGREIGVVVCCFLSVIFCLIRIIHNILELFVLLVANLLPLIPFLYAIWEVLYAADWMPSWLARIDIPLIGIKLDHAFFIDCITLFTEKNIDKFFAKFVITVGGALGLMPLILGRIKCNLKTYWFFRWGRLKESYFHVCHFHWCPKRGNHYSTCGIKQRIKEEFKCRKYLPCFLSNPNPDSSDMGSWKKLTPVFLAFQLILLSSFLISAYSVTRSLFEPSEQSQSRFKPSDLSRITPQISILFNEAKLDNNREISENSTGVKLKKHHKDQLDRFMKRTSNSDKKEASIHIVGYASDIQFNVAGKDSNDLNRRVANLRARGVAKHLRGSHNMIITCTKWEGYEKMQQARPYQYEYSSPIGEIIERLNQSVIVYLIPKSYGRHSDTREHKDVPCQPHPATESP